MIVYLYYFSDLSLCLSLCCCLSVLLFGCLNIFLLYLLIFWNLSLFSIQIELIWLIFATSECDLDVIGNHYQSIEIFLTVQRVIMASDDHVDLNLREIAQLALIQIICIHKYLLIIKVKCFNFLLSSNYLTLFICYWQNWVEGLLTNIPNVW